MSEHTSSAGSPRASPILCPGLGSSTDGSQHLPDFQETDQSSINSASSQEVSTLLRSQSPRPNDTELCEDASKPEEYAVNQPKLAAEAEFSRIRDAYPLLQSTGCTRQFCQAGRMIRTNESRVGRDQPIPVVLEQAADFLRQLRSDNVISSDKLLQQRLASVFKQIDRNSCLCKNSPVASTRNDEDPLHSGGHWDQTLAELEHGVRLAWKHSSRCIMRSEYKSLQVCDLRNIQTSREMGASLIHQLEKAFANGNITPTVFVFPARQAGKRGPLVWNSQLLSFAGYANSDGTIIGDPANVELTSAIIALGWKPPHLPTKWDLLPIVTMAEGDYPFMTEVPEHLFPLVHITHPVYRLQFERLGLRWVPAPALSRLGFDVGGVQYTAAPFIGWFMDAEIGVRDLADQARYNVLPQLITSLGWSNSEQDLERAPEHERLALLSKAQAELNYAVFHSFTAAGVKMSDTLSASNMYCNFDDEHFRDKGFRLPASPYWLAPPQGSIVPIWHRGGAPNYQPMPLICRNRQDPVKAWKRELTKCQLSDVQGVIERASSLSARLTSCPFDETLDGKNALPDSQCPQATAAIHILYCTAASTARKLAQDLQRRLIDAVKAAPSKAFDVSASKALNDFAPHRVSANDVVLIVASTAGRGETPPNGNKFEHNLSATNHKSSFTFSIFGNGNSSYLETYNECAKTIRQQLLKFGAQPLADGFFEGDTAVEDPPWDQFDAWVRDVFSSLALTVENTPHGSDSPSHSRKHCLTDFQQARLVSGGQNGQAGIRHVVLTTEGLHYRALSHIAVIPPNDSKSVRKALQHLGLSGNERIKTADGLTARAFLTDFVDFDQPFTRLPWASLVRLSSAQTKFIASLTVRDALPLLSRSWRRNVLLDDLFNTMPLITPRTFSVASCPESSGKAGAGVLDLLIQSRPGGRVSNFLKLASPGDMLRLKYIDTDVDNLLDDASTPIICFATGSGLAPVRSLLQHRVNQRRSRDSDLATSKDAVAPITLILGFKQRDTPMIANAIRQALAVGIVDILLLTPSNPGKIRPQDRIFEPAVRHRIDEKLRVNHAAVYVCAGAAAADGFASNLSALVGCDIQAALGNRYVQEVYKPAY